MHVAQKKELFRLQAFITSLFQKSEADMIKDIFVMYDTDGSGGIDEDELCAGLTASGGGSSLTRMTQVAGLMHLRQGEGRPTRSDWWFDYLPPLGLPPHDG